MEQPLENSSVEELLSQDTPLSAEWVNCTMKLFWWWSREKPPTAAPKVHSSECKTILLINIYGSERGLETSRPSIKWAVQKKRGDGKKTQMKTIASLGVIIFIQLMWLMGSFLSCILMRPLKSEVESSKKWKITKVSPQRLGLQRLCTAIKSLFNRGYSVEIKESVFQGFSSESEFWNTEGSLKMIKIYTDLKVIRRVTMFIFYRFLL